MKSPNFPHLKNKDAALEDVNYARRKVFTLAAAPLLLLGLDARAADSTACFDMDTMAANQKSMRRSLGFKLESPDEKKHCGTCAFFTASAGECGKCALLSGGPVATTNVCDSWAAKS